MIEAIVAGAVAGYAIAIPVGAIAVLIIHIALSHGWRTGAAAAAGAATADGIYATLAALAGAAIASLVGPLMLPLRIVGGAALLAIGGRGLLLLWRARGSSPPAETVRPRAVHGRTYLELLGLTLLNPVTIVYFAALTVGLPFLGGTAERLVFAVAAFVASLSWQLLLAAIGAGLGRRAGHQLRAPTMVIGNVIIVLFGVLVIAQAFGGA